MSKALKYILTALSVAIVAALVYSCVENAKEYGELVSYGVQNPFYRIYIRTAIFSGAGAVLILASNFLMWRYDLIGTEAQRIERKEAAAARKKARLEQELEKLK